MRRNVVVVHITRDILIMMEEAYVIFFWLALLVRITSPGMK